MSAILFRTICALSAAAFVVAPSSGQNQRSRFVAIRDVTVIPVTVNGAARREHMTVLVDGEKIAAIGPSSEVVVPAGARQINGHGKFLIPGLIDLHVHLSKTRASAMQLFVANGVTTVRDMGGDAEELAGWRRNVESGHTVGPRIVMAGSIIESARNIERMRKDPPAARVEPFERVRIAVASAEQAGLAVASLAARQVDFLKIRTVADEQTYLALNAAANAHGIPLVGHVTGLSPAIVLKAGQDGIDHWFYPSVEADGERVALWKEFALRGVPIVPTILVLPAATFTTAERLREIVNDDSGVVEPRRKFLSKYLVLDWREQASEVSAQRSAALERIWKTIIRRDLREMHAAGMDVLVGTDTAVLNVYPGFSIHDEMALFVTELGMTPSEVIERATRRSAQFLRLGDSLGTVERGKVADLLLLDADPLQDIRNTSQISAILARGRVYDRAALERLKTATLTAPDVKADDWGRTRKR